MKSFIDGIGVGFGIGTGCTLVLFGFYAALTIYEDIRQKKEKENRTVRDEK